MYNLEMEIFIPLINLKKCYNRLVKNIEGCKQSENNIYTQLTFTKRQQNLILVKCVSKLVFSQGLNSKPSNAFNRIGETWSG
jgi:hypothetical protein